MAWNICLAVLQTCVVQQTKGRKLKLSKLLSSLEDFAFDASDKAKGRYSEAEENSKEKLSEEIRELFDFDKAKTEVIQKESQYFDEEEENQFSESDFQQTVEKNLDLSKQFEEFVEELVSKEKELSELEKKKELNNVIEERNTKIADLERELENRKLDKEKQVREETEKKLERVGELKKKIAELQIKKEEVKKKVE
ncbi:12000_t:CDS:2 [Entrophospora sp. SA101]|nr:12000_t:CDS:2 [Entrophospora sp. SA101]